MLHWKEIIKHWLHKTTTPSRSKRNIEHTTTEIFNRGRQNRLTVAGNATATDERPRLIVALTVAVVQPSRLICFAMLLCWLSLPLRHAQFVKY